MTLNKNMSGSTAIVRVNTCTETGVTIPVTVGTVVVLVYVVISVIDKLSADITAVYEGTSTAVSCTETGDTNPLLTLLLLLLLRVNMVKLSSPPPVNHKVHTSG